MLIVFGGIATGLLGTGETPAIVTSPVALQEKEAAVPATASWTVTPHDRDRKRHRWPGGRRGRDSDRTICACHAGRGQIFRTAGNT